MCVCFHEACEYIGLSPFPSDQNLRDPTKHVKILLVTKNWEGGLPNEYNYTPRQT